MIKGSIKVGNSTIQIEGSTPVELVKNAGFWGECPTKCGGCSSEDIGFFARIPKGNLYVGMKCRGCGYEMNFGQNKEGGGLFIKDGGKWNAPYGGGSSGGGGSSAMDDEDDDDIPFS